MIIEITRGHIRLQIDNKVVTVRGEALLSGNDLPAYVVYSDSIQNWDPPHENVIIDHHLKNKIIEILKTEIANKNIKWRLIETFVFPFLALKIKQLIMDLSLLESQI